MKNTHMFRNFIIVLFVIATLFSLTACNGTASSNNVRVEETVIDNEFIPCQLIRVVDGDTLVVVFNGKETKVRMIGVNTPESVSNDSSRNTKEGKIASDYMKNLLSNHSTVWLELDEDWYDKYDRLLAYVYLEDGTMLNEHMLSIGYARTMFYAPNFKHQTLLESAQKSAQKQQAGFWPTKSGRDALYG
jgi:micrococcal nuclease